MLYHSAKRVPPKLNPLLNSEPVLVFLLKATYVGLGRGLLKPLLVRTDCFSCEEKYYIAIKCKPTNRQPHIYNTEGSRGIAGKWNLFPLLIGATGICGLPRIPHQTGYIICGIQCKVKT
jgi:hypothetical protein